MRLILVALLMASWAVQAQHIQSDEWPATAAQPTQCFIIVDSKPTRSSIVAKNLTTGGVFCYVDIGMETVGSHTSLINACNGTLCGSDVAFSFVNPVPAVAPANVKNLRVVP